MAARLAQSLARESIREGAERRDAQDEVALIRRRSPMVGWNSAPNSRKKLPFARRKPSIDGIPLPGDTVSYAIVFAVFS